mgnify:CR=1 FL=1
MFEGHQLYKIDDEWVFNLTEFTGYRVNVNKEDNTVISYDKAFRLIKTLNDYSYDKYMSVPIGVLRKSINIVENYQKEAFLCNGY